MPDWRIKGLVQGAIATLPASDRVNFVFQRYVTRTAVLHGDWFAHKLDQAGAHWRHWSAPGPGRSHPGAPARVLEVGTGWHPVVALALALGGAGQVLTFDRVPLLRSWTLVPTVRAMVAAVDEGRFGPDLPPPDPQRLAVLRELAARPRLAATDLARVGVSVRIADVRDTGLPPASIDLFVSNNTFEHIPGDVLDGICRSYRVLCTPDAVMSHFVDMSDHYSHFDPDISPVHFLRFEDRAWRKWDNDIVPQNRLRLSDYRRLLTAAGFEVVAEEANCLAVELVTQVPVADRFARYPVEELQVTHVWFTAVPV
jgi:hypothetical protein